MTQINDIATAVVTYNTRRTFYCWEDEDNDACTAMGNAQKPTPRTRHIDIKYFWVREQVELGEITMTYCPTDKMLADIMTKPLPINTFERLRSQLRIVDINEIIEKNQNSFRWSEGVMICSFIIWINFGQSFYFIINNNNLGWRNRRWINLGRRIWRWVPS